MLAQTNALAYNRKQKRILKNSLEVYFWGKIIYGHDENCGLFEKGEKRLEPVFQL
jgi:hypothetical protein